MSIEYPHDDKFESALKCALSHATFEAGLSWLMQWEHERALRRFLAISRRETCFGFIIDRYLAARCPTGATMPQTHDLSGAFVFLGGTCAGPDYRNELIPKLTVDYFNPVVEHWTPEDAARENEAKAQAAVNVFVLTPAAIGSYSVAELTELAITSSRPLFVLFHEPDGFKWNEHQIKSNTQIEALLSRYGRKTCRSMNKLAECVNALLG